mgnify:FL=1
MSPESQDAEKPDRLNQPLNEQLREARLELQQLEELIADVPELMQRRFQQELQHVLNRNQRLIAERNQLLTALNNQQVRLSGSRRSPDLRNLPTWGWLTLTACLIALAAGFLRPWIHGTLTSVQTKPVTVAPLRTPHLTTGKTVTVAGDPHSVLDLESQQTSWVEVTTRHGELVWQDTLRPGDQRRIRLRDGLRLRTNQPAQLRYRVDEGGWLVWPVAAKRWLELIPRSP